MYTFTHVIAELKATGLYELTIDTHTITHDSNTFDKQYKTTIGADFVRKDVAVRLQGSDEVVRVRLQLWDIAGQDRFQKLTRAYFNKARGIATTV